MMKMIITLTLYENDIVARREGNLHTYNIFTRLLITANSHKLSLLTMQAALINSFRAGSLAKLKIKY